MAHRITPPQRITLRHVRQEDRIDDPNPLPGATVLGTDWAPEKREAINGDGGFVSGQHERRLREEGTASLVFPNEAGGDGVLHRRRFDLHADEDYGPGDEWIEVYEGEDPDPIAVFTPTGGDRLRSRVTLDGKDGLWTLVKVRETAAGDWHHAPRDVIEHYLGAWVAVAANDMTTDPLASTGPFGPLWEAPDGGALVAGDKFRISSDGTGDPGTDEYIHGDDSPSRNRYRWGRAASGASGHGCRNRCVRFEAQLDIPTDVDTVVHVGFRDDTSPGFACAVVINPVGIGTRGTSRCVSGAEFGAQAHFVTGYKTHPNHGVSWHVAVELRGAWVYYYIDGNLITVLPALFDDPTGGGHDGDAIMVPYVSAGTFAGSIDIDHLLVRALRPYLLRDPADDDQQNDDRGDFHLPGLPPADGLWGEFFDDATLRQEYDDATAVGYRMRTLAPHQEPRFSRVDENLAFAVADPPAWQPIATPDGDHWSARWTGSVWLDLEAADVRLRTITGESGGEGDRVRLWVGRTLWGDQLIDTFEAVALGGDTNTTAQLRAHLTRGADGAYETGWYPIVVEYMHGAGEGGIQLQRELSTAAGVWSTVPTADLSPIGVWDGATRFEPHLELVKNVAEAFGYQFTAEPRSLESGEFPCTVRPVARVGRDTDKVLESDDATDVGVKVNAEDVAEALVGDAQGLARDDQSQVTAERVDFLRAGAAPFVRSDHESLGDISSAQLLEQRLDSLMALRGGPWEEVNARPPGYRELRDAFPLPAIPDREEFAWGVGDGVRLRLPEVDVEDAAPRQIMGVTRGFTPAGLGDATAAFRQRPRNLKNMLRRIQRLQAIRQRHYQGQITTLSGSGGSLGTGVDPYSRVTAPPRVQRVTRATLVVRSKSGGNRHEAYVNDELWMSGILGPGRYDLSDAVASALANAADREVAVHMLPETLENRSNLFGASDPSGEAAAKFPAGTDYTITREASGTGGVPSKYGGFRDKHAYDGSGGGSDITNNKVLTVASAGTYVFSLWVWVPSNWDGGSFNVEVTAYTGATYTIIKYADLAKRDQWQRIWTKAVIVGGDLVGDCRIRRIGASPSSAPTGIIYSDALQAEKVLEGTDPMDFRADVTAVPYYEKVRYSLDLEVVV